VMGDNRRMLRLFQHTGYLIRSKFEEDAWEISFRFDEKAEQPGAKSPSDGGEPARP